MGHGNIVFEVQPRRAGGRHVRQTRHFAVLRTVLPLQVSDQISGRGRHAHGQVQLRRGVTGRHVSDNSGSRVFHVTAQGQKPSFFVERLSFPTRFTRIRQQL